MTDAHESPAGTPTEPLPDLDGLWDYANPAGTEQRFRALLRKDALAGRPAARALVLTQVARCQGLQQHFEEARATLAEAARLLDAVAAAPGLPAASRGDAAPAAADTLSVVRVRLLLERGRVENSARHRTAAIAPFLEAFEVARAAGLEALAIDAAHMLGIAEEPEAALAWNRRALELAEAATDPRARRWVGPLLNNIGWTLSGRGDHAAALVCFERDVAWRAAQGHVPQQRIARWSRAKMLRLLGRVAEALAEQEALAAEHAADGTGDPYVSEERGECLLALGREAEAVAHFAAAHAGLKDDPWLRRDEPERLARLARLGGTPCDEPRAEPPSA